MREEEENDVTFPVNNTTHVAIRLRPAHTAAGRWGSTDPQPHTDIYPKGACEMYAKGTIIGNVTADPVTKRVTVRGEEREVTTFSVAVNDRFNKEKEASFFNDISAWNGVGRNVAKYVRKGSKVAVIAKIEQAKWEKDGHKHSSYKFTAEDVVFLSSNGREDAIPETAIVDSAPPATPTEAVAPTPPTAEPVEEQTQLADAEVPF